MGGNNSKNSLSSSVSDNGPLPPFPVTVNRASSFSSNSSSKQRRVLDEEYFVQKVQLGTGSFGVVHRAIQRSTQQDRAVKSMEKRRFETRSHYRQHLHREIEILRECSHENIVKLYDWFEDETYIHFVLEYCGGGDLGDRILQVGYSGMTEKIACNWMVQIFRAIDHLHAKGVCHRDVKPENFLMTGNNVLKMSDFGLAVRLADPRKSNLRELAGTPAYQAPEVHNLTLSVAPSSNAMLHGYHESIMATPPSGYGLAVDMWACGVTMYVILSGGKNPFVSAKENKLQLADIRSGTIKFDELISTVSNSSKSGSLSGDKKSSSTRTKPNSESNAEQLLRLLLTVDPTRRITIGEAMRHNWFVQLGLASPPPSSPVMSQTPPKLARGAVSVDSGSLEASPPNMEPILVPTDVSRRKSGFELYVEGGSLSPSISPSADSPGNGGMVSMTIGPRGSKEGKVMRCEKCGNFFYSQRGVGGKCPECRVHLGYALPVDGVTPGMTVYHCVEGKKWVCGTVSTFTSNSGEFVLEGNVRINASDAAPPGKGTGMTGTPWKAGTNVVYLSGTYGTWIPAYVESYNSTTGLYDLDVKGSVSADKIRARLKRLTDNAGGTQTPP